MSDHIFRNGDIIQILPHREIIRQRMPNGSEGFVVEDIDLVIRWYGPKYGLGDKGKFMLCEIKHGGRKIVDGQKQEIEFSKEMTFGMIDFLLRKADPDFERYKGFYIIRTFGCADWNDKSKFVVNGNSIKTDDFFCWLDGKFDIAPYTFKKYA